MLTVLRSFFTNIRLLSLVGMMIVISLLHYLLGSAGAGLLHSVLGHLYIVPIILAAYWYGVAGGVTASILASVLFSPHLFMHWMDPFLDLYNFVEIFLFLLIGGTTGILSQMERNQRARYESALTRLDESHRRLREQTDILFQTEEQLRRADRLSALGELSAGMAHEIRNPLGAIKGAAEILRDDFRPGDPKHEFLLILQKETDRLNVILSEFLSFARPKAPERQPVDLNAVVETVLTLAAQPLRRAGVAVVRNFDPALGLHPLDGALMQQAVLNLVLNAIQAMPSGGTLTVETAHTGGRLTLSVADTGPGIAPEHRGRLFSPFFTTKSNGTGLGLAITYRIVQNHGGTIDVASAPGAGARFTIAVPIA